MVGDRKARVLDIGCNDGTMLSYYPENYYKVGVDPSNASDDYKGNDILFVKDIFPTSKLTGQKFDVISSIACLYDLEDPMNFVYEVQEALSADGVWVFEMSYMPSMMNMNAYDTICNEHLEYYSLAVLEYMLNSCNMKLIEVELTNTNGGSILGRAVKKNNELYPVVHEGINELRMLEFEMALDIEKPYRKFAERSYILNANLMWLLRTLQKKGKVVHLYGASTKGNTTLQLAGIDNTIIPYAAERNPDKWGAKTLGSNIEIISEEESRAMKPSAYLVLPWHFRKEFIVREADTITSGIDFIFPLPSIEIVTKDGTKTFEEYMNMLGEKGIY
jgi:SAM-dependent methyltransferase